LDVRIEIPQSTILSHHSTKLCGEPVVDFIYRPIFFAGVGLVQEELGLWWLLNQRQRNYARVDADKIPPVFILVHQSDPRLPFWQSHPFGVKPLLCSDWDHGWELVQEEAKKLQI
jgi:hypothetical protein